MDSSANSSISTLTFLNIFYSCASSVTGNAAFTAWFVLYLLLSPLFLFVLLIGMKKWQKQRNSKALSHSDIFTFHVMVMELLMIFGAATFMYGLRTRTEQIADIGITIQTLSASGQMYFHSLTCGERYLAVVHPITYLRLKKKGGVTIRNISIGVVWFLSFIYTTVVSVIPDLSPRMITSLLMVVIAIVPMIFCSVSALCVLIRPGPGDGNKKRLDQSKRSAFITITAILGVLLVRMVQLLVINFWLILVGLDSCVLTITTLWSSVPSSLVLPLLFLHRAGKLPTCC